MRRYFLMMVIAAFGIYMFGCARKETAQEDLQEPISMESLSTVTESTAKAKPAVSTTEVAMSQTEFNPEVKLETLPPSGPYKPATSEIQTALKNAGFYAGSIDGKKGPMTNKAVEDFQKAHNLKVDGRVGTQTWAVLSTYLNPTATKAKKR